MKKIVLSLGILTSTLFACYSDFDCGIGYRCIKQPYHMNGVCMRSVNQFGVPQFNMPSLNSVGVRMNNNGCNFDTECPIGFRCNRTYKVCVRR